MTEPDPEVRDLLDQRLAARERRDFATADAIRDQLRQAGWLVRDTTDGPVLDPAPPYRTVDPATLASRWDEPDRGEVSVVVHVAGWPEDVARATRALAAHHRHLGYEVLLVDDGAGEATGRALEGLASLDPHVKVLHLDPAIGFGASMNLAMGQALGRVLVWLDRAVPRALAARVRVDPKDRYYRNADLDYSFAVRALGYEATRVEIPATRHRHRGFHDTDPGQRDRESRKNYDRFLRRWKGRTDLLTRGFRGYHRHR